VGWIDNKLEELSRFAADPGAGGGLQSVDYLVLQMLNRQIPVLKHFARSRFVHPERLFDELLRLAGELATFATRERRANLKMIELMEQGNIALKLIAPIENVCRL